MGTPNQQPNQTKPNQSNKKGNNPDPKIMAKPIVSK
jgi:hypothetical protein